MSEGENGEKVFDPTPQRLAEALGVPADQLDSLIDLVRSQLALTVNDALKRG